MPVRKVSFVSGEFYHVYNRGNSRQEIFHSQTDYDRFSALLYAANGAASIDSREVSLEDMFTFDRGEQQVAIGAYCLMPNHFHILVTPLVEGGLITFMRKLATGYSMYFNKKHHRTGSLFEGRFKSVAPEDRPPGRRPPGRILTTEVPNSGGPASGKKTLRSPEGFSVAW